MERKVARGQRLPLEEVDYLGTLKPYELKQRAYDLYNAGWALDAIGSELDPPRPRNTIYNWIRQIERSETRITLDAPTPRPESAIIVRRYRSPGIDEDTATRLQYLGGLAKNYRAKMNSFSEPAVANRRLTTLCKELQDKGVSIRELAEATGVTYRAMYKRLNK